MNTMIPRPCRRDGLMGLALGLMLGCSCGDDDGAASSTESTSSAATAAAGSASASGSSGEPTSSGLAGASVHYYFYRDLGMLQCPGLIAGYDTQVACDDLGRSQTENGPVNQVGLSCDGDPEGCIVGDRLMVTATDRCPDAPRSVRVTYKETTLTLRIVDRTPGSGGFDLGLDPYIDLGIDDDFMIGVSGPEDITYECLP